MKTGRLLDVDLHHDFRTLMEHKAFLSRWCRTSMHTMEEDVFFVNALNFSCTNSPRRKISGDVFGDSAYQGAKEHNTCDQHQSRCHKDNVCLRRFMHPNSLVSDADSDKNVVSVLGSHELFA